MLQPDEPLTQCDEGPYEKGKLGPRYTHRGKCRVDADTETQVMLLQAKESQRCLASYQTLGERGMGQVLFTALRRNLPSPTA